MEMNAFLCSLYVELKGDLVLMHNSTFPASVPSLNIRPSDICY